MPLSAEDKNLIAQGGTVASQLAIVEAAGLGLAGASLIALPFIPLILGLQAAFNRVRFPRLSPGDIGRTARAAGEGFVVSSDPFFGDVVLSRPDQGPHLAELIRNSAIRRVAAELNSERLFLDRRLIIQGLAESAEERGFATTIDPNLRGGVFRPSADEPLQFIRSLA